MVPEVPQYPIILAIAAAEPSIASTDYLVRTCAESIGACRSASCFKGSA
jgi:hypothetical protein